MPRQTIAVVVPVFNDWESLERLLREIEGCGLQQTVRVIVVDDFSVEPRTPAFRPAPGSPVREVEIVRLVCNLGHQRAIAVGLAVAAESEEVTTAVVMDADGEDLPGDIPALLAAAAAEPGTIICAQRAQRSESWSFKTFYVVYKLLFRLLTGKVIDFGNFCVLPRRALVSLVHNADTWNNLAAAVTRSRIPFRRLPTKRGRRYAGQSTMNLISLVLHGLSAVSVYGEVALVRILILMLSLGGLTALGLVAVLCLRLFTDLAIPGWASDVAGSLAGILVQSLVFSAVSIFMLLNGRNAPLLIPAIAAHRYVLSRTTCVEAGTEAALV